jgi:hypothetical protein
MILEILAVNSMHFVKTHVYLENTKVEKHEIFLGSFSCHLSCMSQRNSRKRIKKPEKSVMPNKKIKENPTPGTKE